MYCLWAESEIAFLPSTASGTLHTAFTINSSTADGSQPNSLLVIQMELHFVLGDTTELWKGFLHVYVLQVQRMQDVHTNQIPQGILKPISRQVDSAI
jgi:hypothetical protein